MKSHYLNLLLASIFTLLMAEIKAQSQSDSTLNEMSLEDLMNIKVTTASKVKEKIQDAAAIISVVTAQDIESYGALTMVDVLNRVTDLYMTGSYYFPNNMAGIRGDVQVHTSSHVLILIDGRPCRESLYGGVDLAVYNAFPVSGIERIEIIRGPGSVLYGTNAVSGVINIITKQAADNRGQLSAKVGSFGTKTLSYQNSFAINDLKISTSAQYLSQMGWDFTSADASKNHTVKTTKYGQENLGFNVNASYKAFTFRSFYGNSGRDIFGDKPLWAANGTFNTLNTHRFFADLGFKHTFSNKWDMTINETVNNFQQKSLRDGIPVDFNSTDYLTEMTHHIQINDKFKIVAGALLNEITGVGKATDTIVKQPAEWISSYAELRGAIYAQADYKVFSFLKLIAGAQYNKTANLAGNLAPRGGAIIYFIPEFGLKGLYGQAFKSASQSDRYSAVPGSNYGNPNLLPEIVSTTDVQLFYVKGRIQANLGAFYSHQINSINRVPDPAQGAGAITYANLGYLNMKGIEAEFKWTISSSFGFQSNFSYQTNVNNLGQVDVTAISNFMAKGGLNYQNEFLKIGIFNSFFSKPADVINSQSNMAASAQRVIVNPAPGAFNMLTANVMLNVNKIFKWKEAPTLLLNIYGDNLLNQKVYNPEFSRRNINSLPARGGISVYGGFSIQF